MNVSAENSFSYDENTSDWKYGHARCTSTSCSAPYTCCFYSDTELTHPIDRYDMRREMQSIVPNLFLGPYSCARDRPLLLTHGVTHLLCILDVREARIMRVVHPDLVYHFINVSDSFSENLIPHFPAAREFLQQALANPSHKVLVYCNNGMSRSPCFVIAYLMEILNWDFPTAYGYVQNRRFCISPNDNFKLQLKV
ncbi:protein-tyrosine phosphatase-like protein [Chytriomyces cf. hyalinus JEL632]|nr:protein-tyrosine phosphatase-like protein [Chytriomyces cf. hyalinus JEL632]